MIAEQGWILPLALLAACFLIGVIAVPAGIGGGTLFVPLASALFPFHLDVVRGAGVVVALASALAAAPYLLRSGVGSLRLALPLALFGSVAAVIGALIGAAIPEQLMQLLLGLLVLGIAVLMLTVKGVNVPQVTTPDPVAQVFGLSGMFWDRAARRNLSWQAHRTPQGMLLFAVIGLVGGMFGIGAGWANVPVLNLLMGVPLKMAAGTSGIVLSLVNSSASWAYLHQGYVVSAIAVPAIIGTMLGAKIGARLLHVLHGPVIRRLVILLLMAAGIRALLRGMGVWA